MTASPNVFLCCLLVAVGIAFHFILKLQELENQGQIVLPWQYWRQHPYTSLVVVMGAYLFLAMELSIHEATYTTALLTGVACNSVGDKLRARAQAKLDAMP